MGINETIANSIRNYPTIFRCRTDVLEHWFCVIGNGKEWRDGKIGVNDAPVRTLDQVVRDCIVGIDLPDRFVDADVELRSKILNAKRVSDVTFTYNNADDLAQMSWSSLEDSFFKSKDIYPLCEYSLMTKVPDDVDLEYLAAVREMIIAVFSSKPRIRYWRQTQEQAEQEHANNIAVADRVLQDLARRFGTSNCYTSYEHWKGSMSQAVGKILKTLKKGVDSQD